MFQEIQMFTSCPVHSLSYCLFIDVYNMEGVVSQFKHIVMCLYESEK